MAFQVFITVAGTRTDYTRYVTAGSLQIQDQLNVPTLCSFTVVNQDPLFIVPIQGAYIEVWSNQNQRYLFTGYITSQPASTFLGLNPNAGPSTPDNKATAAMFSYAVLGTSEEYLLNNVPQTFLPPFTNRTQGEILGTIATALKPSLGLDVTSYVASGDIVPYFEYDPTQSWSALAKQFADASRYRYKVLNKVLYFQPYGDASLGIAYNTAPGPRSDPSRNERSFDPRGMNLQVLDTPLTNDVLVVGEPEAGSYCQDLFMGDGFTSNFLLSNEGFQAETDLLINENWDASSVDTSKWTVSDAANQFQLFQGTLNILGGTSGAIASEFIAGKNGFELGGALAIQHGEVVFTGPSYGLIGGMYTRYRNTGPGGAQTLLQSDCLFGFLITASGGNSYINFWANGASAGLPILVNANPSNPHHYQLFTQFSSTQQWRYNRIFRTLAGTAFGGTYINSTLTVSLIVYDINPVPPPTAINPLGVVNPSVFTGFIQVDSNGTLLPQNKPIISQYQFTLSNPPSFALYAPINSGYLNCTVNSTLVIMPPQASLYETQLVGQPSQLSRIIDLVSGQETVYNITNDGSLLANSQASIAYPYQLYVLPSFSATAWMYMGIVQPSYLLTLPNQQIQVSMPPVSGANQVFSPSLSASWLLGQQASASSLVSQPTKMPGFVLSYGLNAPAGVVQNRSYIYDDALALFAYLLGANQSQASAVASQFVNLIGLPGASGLYSSYDVSTGAPSELTTKTGPMSWAAYALAFYYKQTADATIPVQLKQLLSFISSLQWTVAGDKRYQLMMKGSGYYQSNGTFVPGELSSCLTEENIMAFFAFSWAQYALNNPTITAVNNFTSIQHSVDCKTYASQLQNALLTNMFITSDPVTGSGRFAMGAASGGTLDYGVSLNAQIWGACFCMSIGRYDLAQQCLDFVFNYLYLGTALYKKNLTVALSAVTNTLNSFYQESIPFDGLAPFANDPNSGDNPTPPQGSQQEGTWAAIAALSQFFQSVQFPYNSTTFSLGSLTPSSRIHKVLGFGFLNQDATLSAGQNNTTQLQYYNDSIPPLQTIVELRYRKNQRAIARVQDPASITKQAVITGDDGHRGLILSNLNPLPRSSAECELAGQAQITDTETPIYQGTYSAWYYFWNMNSNPSQDFPFTGRYLPVNDAERGILNQNFLIRRITTSVVELQGEIVQYALSFGQDTYLAKLLPTFNIPANVYRPQDTSVNPTVLQMSQVGSAYLSDFDSIIVTNVSSSGASLDLGMVPATGAEVRTSDLGWGSGATSNLVGIYTTQKFTVVRKSDDETFYVRQVKGNVSSRYTSVIRIKIPLAPAPPSPQILFSSPLNTLPGGGVTGVVIDPTHPVVQIGLNGNIQDVLGVEVRAADNATVLYRKQYVSEGDLSFTYDNTGALARTLTFWVYTFNALNTYSAGVQVTATLPVPAAPNINIQKQTTGSASIGFDTLGGHPVANVTLDISASAASGAGSFSSVFLETTTPGQPTQVSVQLPVQQVYWMRAKRNDYLGDSAWSATQLLDQTAVPAAAHTENIVAPNVYDCSSATPFVLAGGASVDTANHRLVIPVGTYVQTWLTTTGLKTGVSRMSPGQDFTLSFAIQGATGGGGERAQDFLVDFYTQPVIDGTFAQMFISGKSIGTYTTFYIYLKTPPAGSEPLSFILFTTSNSVITYYVTAIVVTRGRTGWYNTPPISDGGSAAAPTLGAIGAGTDQVVLNGGGVNTGGAGNPKAALQ